ncbi:MAG: hypothetical protein AABX70_03880 [Nanoarchaeota archaeon]
MKCPKCDKQMKAVKVIVHGAKQKAISYQCSGCDYFAFEQLSAGKVLKELQDTPLKIKQRVVKLSQDRLGIYFNSHVVRSLDLKKGEELYVSVPDRKHIILELRG